VASAFHSEQFFIGKRGVTTLAFGDCWISPFLACSPPPTLSLCRFAVGSALADNLRRDIVLAWPIFQPQSGVSADAGNDLRGVMGTGRRGDGAVQSWVKPTEAAGAAEEAHHRWPVGRSENGREQGKG